MKILNQDISATFAVNWLSNGIVGAAALFGALAYFGVGIELPFARADEVKQIQTDVTDIKSQLHQTNCVMLRVSKRNAEDDLAKAQADLERNPNSVSAAQAKENAQESIADIKQQIDKQGCRQP